MAQTYVTRSVALPGDLNDRWEQYVAAAQADGYDVNFSGTVVQLLRQLLESPAPRRRTGSAKP